MDKKIAGLIGAVSALASFDVAHAATTSHVQDVMTVNSYDDLLKPIPNAVETLKASNAVLAEQAASDNGAKLEMAQYYHHHHHHHRFFRPFYRHHHHHHHHFFRHHHHHHHHYYPY
jgi:hypothetical protein